MTRPRTRTGSGAVTETGTGTETGIGARSGTGTRTGAGTKTRTGIGPKAGAGTKAGALASLPRPRRPLGYTPRASWGLAAYERVLQRAGLGPVAGVDEAGRGACAGPLVVAAAVLHPGRQGEVPGLADSKELTPAVRELVFHNVVRAALTWHVVVIPAGDIDRLGLHVCNVTGMRRALAGLRCRPGYALTDGFPVRGLDVPSLAMWKGDQVAACVAAASILAKVTRDRIMADLDEWYPRYGFARHKGYCTPDHSAALTAHGPCPEHRFSYANVIESVRAHATAKSESAKPESAKRESAGFEVTSSATAGAGAAGAGGGSGSHA